MTDWMKELDSAPAEIAAPVKLDNAVSRLKRIAKWKNHPADDLLDWYRDDLQHLAGVTDTDLQTIVMDYLGSLKLYGRELPEEKFKPHCVKCADCMHFVRSDHPHLGTCSAGAHQSAPAGFWDSHLRGCSSFIEETKAI
jgi:hypothetical protein